MIGASPGSVLDAAMTGTASVLSGRCWWSGDNPAAYRLGHGSPVPPVLSRRKSDGSARRALDDADHERTALRQQPLQRAASRPADHVADPAVQTDAAAGSGG